MKLQNVVIVSFVFLVACAAPPKVVQSGLEIQAYQSHEFEAPKRIAFDSTMSVLQDSGFIIESADYETGFITGRGTSASRTDFWYGATNEHVEMTAFVEQRTSSISRVRVNLIDSSQRKSAWNPAQDVINERGVRDPVTYQKLFDLISQTIFVRENL
jgi:hypothetical protein